MPDYRFTCQRYGCQRISRVTEFPINESLCPQCGMRRGSIADPKMNLSNWTMQEKPVYLGAREYPLAYGWNGERKA